LHRLTVDVESCEENGVGILELGAGTGLVGLSAAAIWKTSVVLSDLKPIVPGLIRNIDVNRFVLAERNAKVIAGTLDWSRPETLHLPTGEVFSSANDKAGIILAADTIYSEDHPQLLTKAIFAWLRPGSTSRVIIAYPLRVAYLDALRELWARLEGGGLHSIKEGKSEVGDEWDDEPCIEWSVWAWQQ
jgi:predicted nicotinamide N-methyase